MSGTHLPVRMPSAGTPLGTAVCDTCAFMDALWVIGLVTVLVANLGGLALVVWDKRQARRRRRRVPERHLVMLSLLGGWPLMLLGMLLVRHKVRKPRFLVPFALAAAPSLAVLLLQVVLPRLS